jgi:hypothetical protein
LVCTSTPAFSVRVRVRVRVRVNVRVRVRVGDVLHWKGCVPPLCSLLKQRRLFSSQVLRCCDVISVATESMVSIVEASSVVSSAAKSCSVVTELRVTDRVDGYRTTWQRVFSAATEFTTATLTLTLALTLTLTLTLTINYSQAHRAFSSATEYATAAIKSRKEDVEDVEDVEESRVARHKKQKASTRHGWAKT